MPNYDVERPTCWVKINFRSKCGKPRSFWTNHMEPVCAEHFRQRRAIMSLLVLLSGHGSWARLIVASNPEAFKRDSLHARI